MPAMRVLRPLVGFRFIRSVALRQWPVLAAVSMAAAGCGDGPAAPDGAHYHMEVIGGDGQAGAPGWELEDWLTVRVTDSDGAPASGVRVSFQVTAGEGSVFPSSVLVAASGQARARWRLGPPTFPHQAVEVSLEGERPAETFTATTLGQDEVDLVVVHGTLGPLKGLVLARDDGNLQPIASRAVADTLIPLPPIQDSGVTLVVFAYANRPAQIAPAWTTGVDTVHLELLPPVDVDIDFDVQDGNYQQRIGQLNTALDTMKAIWKDEGMGIVLGQVTFTDNTGQSGLDVSPPTTCFPYDFDEAIQVSIFSSIGGQTTTGYSCASGHVMLGRDFSLIPYLLAHEIAHTFALTHSGSGLMRETADERDVFDGQTYRAHFHEASALNTLFSSEPVVQRRNCSVYGICLPETLDLEQD